jgi:hypothetical protein
MLDRVLGLASALSFAVGAVSAPAGPRAEVVFTFDDPAIVESSGLVALDDAARNGLFVTVNDSGDRGRVFVVDRRGHTVGVTSWSADVVDVESLAPAGPGEVWVGDTGDNRGARDSVTVLRVPVGRGDRTVTPTAYDLVYPGGGRDAETLMSDPRTGRLFVVSKDIFGGTVYAAPRRLSADRPNRLRPVADSVALATDGSFFPDGRHYVVRGYGSASVYGYPSHELIGSFPLPRQRQGEGIAVGADGALYLSTEGQFTDVLRMRVPRKVARAMEPIPSASPSATPPGSAPAPVVVTEETGTPWPWLAGGALAVVFVALGCWLLIRRGQAP